ncbi:hypothetical protein [Humibacter antri]
MRIAHVVRVAAVVLALGTVGAAGAFVASEPAHASVSHASDLRPSSGGDIRPFAADPVSSLTLDRFDAVFDLHRDAAKNSSMTITETIGVRFPEADVNHGIERAIPTFNQDIALHPRILSITDAPGHAPAVHDGEQQRRRLRRRHDRSAHR